MIDLLNSLKDKLDLSEIDLTPPDEIVKNFLSELPDITKNMVIGKLETYKGHVETYTTTELIYPPRTINQMLSDMCPKHATDKEPREPKEVVKRVDIQNDLGKQGEKYRDFECFLQTPQYEKYKYRLFFMRYGLAKYPVQFTLEESIANSISSLNSRYIVKKNNRAEVESLMSSIFSSPKVVNVIQELIRISQSEKDQPSEIEEKC